MTQTTFTILTIIAILIVAIAFEYYKVVIKKKERDKTLIYRFLLLVVVFLFANSHASYHTSIAKYERTQLNIPVLQETMDLSYRSRYKEIWMNKDTSKIKHASKVIRLNNSIEKEIDFFTNEKRVRTLKIKTTFPFASRNVIQKYFLIVGIETDEITLGFNWDEIEISSFQKDSILSDWNLKKNENITLSSIQ